MLGALAWTPAWARWVEFEACGLTEPGPSIEGYAFAEAPNLGKLRIWITPGIVVSEIHVGPGEKVCTGLAVGAYRYIVVGDYEAVVCKLSPHAPYCDRTR